MNKKERGFSLLEVFISFIILSLVMSGLANVFIAVKRHTLHSRSKLQTTELGKLFLAPLNMDVDQSEWNSADNDYTKNPSSLLRKTPPGSPRSGNPITLNRIEYTPKYDVGVPPGFADTSAMRKVKVTITWIEPSP